MTCCVKRGSFRRRSNLSGPSVRARSSSPSSNNTPLMIQNLYQIVAVGLRLVGLWFVASAALAVIADGALRVSMGGGVMVLPVLIRLLTGVAVWILAKPIARVVTANLE